jgi:hypothetical protein
MEVIVAPRILSHPALHRFSDYGNDNGANSAKGISYSTTVTLRVRDNFPGCNIVAPEPLGR